MSKSKKKDKKVGKVERVNGEANGKSELIDRLNYALSLEFAATIQYLNQQCVVVGHDRQDYAPFFAASSTEAHLHAQNLGNLFHFEPTEVAQFDHLRFPCILVRQPQQRFVKHEEVRRFLRREGECLVKGHMKLPAAALACIGAAGVIHQNLPHHAG